MIILRFLVALALGFAFFYWTRRALRKPERRDAVVQSVLLTCSHCGVNFPAPEAVFVGTTIYCCESHRNAARTSE